MHAPVSMHVLYTSACQTDVSVPICVYICVYACVRICAGIRVHPCARRVVLLWGWGNFLIVCESDSIFRVEQ